MFVCVTKFFLRLPFLYNPNRSRHLKHQVSSLVVALPDCRLFSSEQAAYEFLSSLKWATTDKQQTIFYTYLI